jgi:hypothetical protein
MTVMDHTLCGERIQHLLLVGVRADLESRQGDGHSVVLDATGSFVESVVESIPICVRVVELEGRVVPVGVEPRHASEHPGLGMEASAVSVVLDLHLGTELNDQAVKRRTLGGTHVGRGDDPQRHLALV